MKTFLLATLLLAASASTSFAQTQPATAADPWQDAPAATDDAPRYEMGWNTAPGQSLSLHGKPTTDYWGRPLKKNSKSLTTAATKEVAYAAEESTDPMMHSSGVMVAPGMSSSPYRKVSTDYWGRPLKKNTPSATVAAAKARKSAPVAATTTGW